MTQPVAPKPHPPPDRLRGSWAITYCDMITVLLACFICILTLASKVGTKSKRAGQPIGGTGGSGVFQNGSDGGDAAVWRMRPLTAHERGNSEAAPMYSDPTLEPTDQIQQTLDDPAMGTLRDSYRLQVPLDLLVGSDGALSTAGRQTLDVLARNVRAYPYDIHVLVEENAHLPKATVVGAFFAGAGGIHPGRVAVGVQSGTPSGRALVWLIFFRNS